MAEQEYKYKCECGLKFNLFEAVVRHVCLSHENEFTNLCMTCDMAFKKEHFLAEHPCKILPYTVEFKNDKTKLLMTIQDPHSIEPIKREIQSNDLKGILQSLGIFPTENIKLRNLTPIIMEAVKNNMDKIREVECSHCNIKLNSLDILKHLARGCNTLTTDSTKIPEHKCPHCNLRFSNSENLYAHLCSNPMGDSKEKTHNTSNEDSINPSHYKMAKAKCSKCNNHIECIDVVRHHNMNVGNVIKYLWRADHKGDRLEQLKKAHWYLRDEIKKHEPEFDANK